MSKYLHIFNQQIQNNHTFIDAIAKTIEQYSADLQKYPDFKKDEVCIALEKFYARIFDESLDLGSIIVGYDFKVVMPQDFMLVIEAAQKAECAALIKENAKNSTSHLVSTCENRIAEESHSLNEIVIQTAILVSALRNKHNYSQSHVTEMQSKVEEWRMLLLKKTGETILNSKNIDELKFLLNRDFSDVFIKGLETLENFKEKVMGQIQYLVQQDFFSKYYNNSSLASKYDYVSQYHLESKIRSVAPELIAILSGLLSNIEEQANRPLENKKFKLMASRTGSINEVFHHLNNWAHRHFKRDNQSDLFKELMNRLNQEKETFKVWEEVSHRCQYDTLPRRMYQPLMQDLVRMKYVGDPDQNPRVQLAQLKQMPLSPNEKHSGFNQKISVYRSQIKI